MSEKNAKESIKLSLGKSSGQEDIFIIFVELEKKNIPIIVTGLYIFTVNFTL